MAPKYPSLVREKLGILLGRKNGLRANLYGTLLIKRYPSAKAEGMICTRPLDDSWTYLLVDDANVDVQGYSGVLTSWGFELGCDVSPKCDIAMGEGRWRTGDCLWWLVSVKTGSGTRWCWRVMEVKVILQFELFILCNRGLHKWEWYHFVGFFSEYEWLPVIGECESTSKMAIEHLQIVQAQHHYW